MCNQNSYIFQSDISNFKLVINNCRAFLGLSRYEMQVLGIFYVIYFSEYRIDHLSDCFPVNTVVNTVVNTGCYILHVNCRLVVTLRGREGGG